MKKNTIIVLTLAAMMLTTTATARQRHKLPKESEMSAYLMVYHSDSDPSLHMAISYDGYTFTSLNGGNADS